MRIAHLLRKYNPAEWGGTETVIQQLFDGLRVQGVDSVVYCPSLAASGPNGTAPAAVADPLAAAGCKITRFQACLPIWGITPEERRQMVAVGGNLLSLELLRVLWASRGYSVIHSHTLGRIGGIGLTVARRKKIPFVLTIHGGVYDLPESMRREFDSPKIRGVEWGKLIGVLLRSREVLSSADAIITCNPREAELVRERHPDRRVVVQPHGVRAAIYETDQRAAARAAFPQMVGRDVLLSLGRVDPVKNQGWLIEQVPALLRRHPKVLLVLAGACTNEAYGVALNDRIRELGLEKHVFLTGKLPPADPRLVGLMQEARVALLPSISETFGLVILEAWAAGTPAISSQTSGARQLIEEGKTGWLFDLERPEQFHSAVDVVMTNPERVQDVVAAARARVADYDTRALAGRMKQLYEQLSEEQHAACHSA
ncbi:MAG TPA: glycosyltransferase family 4 protein [Opitutaceae bacterium]|nr:glycosyltransferase family 4 protein [Opitutaceae bacterium]